MKLQNVIMAAAFLLAAVTGFAFKPADRFGTNIYGKIAGECTRLCTNTVSFVCAQSSGDGIYYGNGDCTGVYSSIRYQIPSK